MLLDTDTQLLSKCLRPEADIYIQSQHQPRSSYLRKEGAAYGQVVFRYRDGATHGGLGTEPLALGGF